MKPFKSYEIKRDEWDAGRKWAVQIPTDEDYVHEFDDFRFFWTRQEARDWIASYNMSQLITQQNNEIAETLEALIDTNSVCYVLNEIVQIAYGKTEHIRSNWGDANLAQEWEALARNLDALADKHDSL
jgi:hypothetical protein